ncbi:MAG: hypothetical protein IJ454_01600, partial [Clostridia bacterium]|nr:hypothetical protein [Clostridia bacterium]
MDKCFNFAYVTDTHLSDSGEVTAKEILKSDKGFKCIVHGGNALNGNNPEAISMRLLGMEYDRYRSAVKSHIILPVQGEQDGWRNERFKGQLAVNIMTDKVWSDNISFVDKYKGTCRPVDAPYYYVDFAEDKVRLVVLSSYFCEYDEEYGLFEKFRGFKAEQLRWLIGEALNTPEDYRVIIFSNTVPKSRFETGKDPYI